jgi:hypothetical protein
VYNDVLNGSSFHARLTATVGGQTFPTPAQEANGALGYVLASVVGTSAADTNYHYGWHAIRTDRALFLRLDSIYWYSTQVSGLIVGDMPTLDPADPGLCVLLASRSSTYPTAQGLSHVWDYSTTPHNSIAFCGYAYASKTLGVFSVPASIRRHHYTDSNSNLLVDWAGKVPIFPTLIYTGTSTTSSVPIMRGWIPYSYHFPTTDGVAIGDGNAVYTGDTFSAGAANFELYRGGNSIFGWMTNDQEDLP